MYGMAYSLFEFVYLVFVSDGSDGQGGQGRCQEKAVHHLPPLFPYAYQVKILIPNSYEVKTYILLGLYVSQINQVS